MTAAIRARRAVMALGLPAQYDAESHRDADVHGKDGRAWRPPWDATAVRSV